MKVRRFLYSRRDIQSILWLIGVVRKSSFFFGRHSISIILLFWQQCNTLDVRFIWQEIYFSLILQVIEIRAVCIVAFILRVEVIAAIPIPSRAFLSIFFILGIVKAIAFTRYFYVFCTEHFVWRISDRALVSVTASNAAFQLNIFRQLVLQIRKRIVKWVMCSDSDDFFSLIIGFDGHRCYIIHIRFIKFDLKIKTLHFAISRDLNLLVNHFFTTFFVRTWSPNSSSVHMNSKWSSIFFRRKRTTVSTCLGTIAWIKMLLFTLITQPSSWLSYHF